MNQLIDKINVKIDYPIFYSEFAKDVKKLGGVEYQGRCPLHEDKTPSFGFNGTTGQWICHAGCGSGNIFSFVQKYMNIESKEASKWICDKLGIEMTIAKKIIIEEKIYKDMHMTLRKNKAMVDLLYNKRGLSPEAINEFKIGYNQGRITIPIFDDVGDCVNVRRYSFQEKATNKMISYKSGYGEARLFPIKNMKHNSIVLCEGEMDCLLLNQLGFPAITVTSGVGTWKGSWTNLFRDKTVYICFDIDMPGKKGSIKVANLLLEVTKQIYILNIPLNEPSNADVTNYFIDSGASIADFKELMSNCRRYKLSEEKNKEVVYTKVELAEASQSINYFKNVELKVLIAGKDLSPYLVPQKMKFTCDMSFGKACPFCPVGLVGGSKEMEFDLDGTEILEMVNIPKRQLESLIKRIAGIPSGCNVFETEVKKALNIEEIRIIPDIDYKDEEQKYVVRQAYYIGHGIESNRVYILRGKTIPDPKTQYVTHMIVEAETAQDTIDTFSMNKKMMKELKIFQI